MQYFSGLSRSRRPAAWCALSLGALLAAPTSTRAAFDSPILHTTPASPTAIAIADFDGDGDRDILILGAASLRLLANNGGGSFAARPDQSGLWSDHAQDLAASDLDGDGDLDLTLAFANFGADGELDGTGGVAVLLNGGGGVFTAADSDLTGTTISVVSADLDGDGDLDVAGTPGGSGVNVFKNDGTGQLSLSGTFIGSFEPVAIDAGDVDLDGDVDLALADRIASKVGVLRNTGAGAYSAAILQETAGRTLDVLMVDADLDGNLDLASANFYNHTVSLLINNGNGTFAPHVTFPAGTFPVHLAAADFDDDDFPDLAVADYNGSSVVILLNNGNGFRAGIAVPAVQNPSRVVQGDLDGDGRADLAVLSSISQRVAVLLSNENAFPAPPPPPPPLVLTVAGTTAKPRSVDLRWTGASGMNVIVNRNGIGILLTPNDGRHTDSPPSKGTFTYQICEVQPKRCSNQVMVSFNR